MFLYIRALGNKRITLIILYKSGTIRIFVHKGEWKEGSQVALSTNHIRENVFLGFFVDV